MPGPLPYDWAWVTDTVATGGMPTTTPEVDALVAAGITHVLDCAGDMPTTAKRVLVADERITYHVNATVDNGLIKPPAWFERSLAFALPALEAGGRILVHCLCGSNRGPSTAYAVLRAQGATAAQAEALVRSARPRAHLVYLPDAEAAVR